MSDASPRQRLPGAPGPFGAAIQGSRSEQQDSFRSVWLAAEQAWLVLVADGMGGHAAGEVASRVAADGFVSTFSALRSDGGSLDDALQQALADANAQIDRYQEDAPETAGMGTTLVAAHLSSDGLAWISVGDSPLWIFRDGKINRVNEDHSLRGAVAAGAVANANALLSALNGTAISLVDCHPKPVRLRPGDLVVLASDGLLTLSEAETARTVRDNASAGPEAVARGLLGAVADRDAPHQDNCTVIVAIPPVRAAVPSPLRWLAAVLVVSVIAVAVIGYLAWP